MNVSDGTKETYPSLLLETRKWPKKYLSSSSIFFTKERLELLIQTLQLSSCLLVSTARSYAEVWVQSGNNSYQKFQISLLPSRGNEKVNFSWRTWTLDWRRPSSHPTPYPTFASKSGLFKSRFLTGRV